jgi:hypothetical protein
MPTIRAKLHTRAVFPGRALIGSLVLTAAIGLGGRDAEAETPSAQSQPPGPSKRVHEMTEVEFGQYVAWLRQAKATPGERIGHAAMRSIGQPYRLGAPMFSLRESDCVTFVERMVAVALSTDWESYCRITHRLRHKDGRVDVLERNYFTLAQWVPNNSWLLTDITAQLGPTTIFRHVDYFKKFYGDLSFGEGPTGKGAAKAAAKAAKIEAVPGEVVTSETYIDRKDVPGVLPQLRTGDVILIIAQGQLACADKSPDCDHMAVLVEQTPWDSIDPDGPPSIVHAVPPKVRRESLVRFVRRFPRIQGIKVLRLRADAEDVASGEDRAMATRITVPAPRPE